MEYYTVKQAVEMLRVTKQRVHALIKSGQLKAEKDELFGFYVISKAELTRFKKLRRPSSIHIAKR